MSDSENRPSIDDILVQWFYDHGKRFRKDDRQDAIAEMVDILVSYGYTRGAIEGARRKIMEKLVGPRSPRGTQGLKEWNAVCKSDLDFILASKFSPIKKPTAPVEIPFTPGTDIAVEASPEPIEPEEIPTSDIEQEVEYEYATEPVIRPEMDRSRFAKIQTTPIMSVEDFFASLEEENNE